MTTTRRTLSDLALDGGRALELIVAESPYGSLQQAVASLALFSHPDTVAQTDGRAVFRIVRGPILQRGQIVPLGDGKPVLLDDNTGPTDTFIWANQFRRGTYNDVQFCHIWPQSGDPEAYTSLANICMLPAFLAKLSDTHPAIMTLLRQRSVDLYGRQPYIESAETSGVAHYLEWAPCLPPNPAVEATMRAELTTKAKSRTTISARLIGWLFSGWEPDASLLES